MSRTIDIKSNGNMKLDVSGIDELTINTEVIPISKELNEVILNNGQINISPEEEGVEYFSNVVLNVQIPPEAEAIQSLRTYSISDIKNYPPEEYVYPDYPYNAMSLVKLKNDYQAKIDEQRFYYTNEFKYRYDISPSQGYEVMREVLMEIEPEITSFYGLAANDKGKFKDVALPFVTFDYANKKTTITLFVGQIVVLGFKRNIYSMGLLQKEVYVINIVKCEYYITQIEINPGCIYKKVTWGGEYEGDTVLSIKDYYDNDISIFYWPWHNYAGDNPEGKPPKLAINKESICYPTENYIFPKLDSVIEVFDYSDIPYTITFLEENDYNNNNN